MNNVLNCCSRDGIYNVIAELQSHILAIYVVVAYSLTTLVSIKTALLCAVNPL